MARNYMNEIANMGFGGGGASGYYSNMNRQYPGVGSFLQQGQRAEELSASATVSIDTPACVRADATSGAVTVTLNPSSSNSLKMMHVMKVDTSANNVVVALPAGDTLYGATASLTLATQYKSVTLLAVNNVNVSGWHIIAIT